uniref:Uncharacterized protein n=1 Tax=Guillardia theta TaxID=55529 RepID=A0A7S4KPZ8_GUITH|mmetsp:Transcript_28783/g.92881  ORF Transcript_28783/g.92881 Transcript_28783/m.92881 type:complete len:405 (+) Transcript_28783:91-1305(+)
MESGLRVLSQRSKVLRNFRATWPTITDMLWRGRFLFYDVALLAYSVQVLRTYGIGAIIRSPKICLIALPWAGRACHRLLHFLLSIPVLPAQLIFNHGIFAKMFPKNFESVNSEMKKYAVFLQKNFEGIPVVISTPDGVNLSGMFFLGKERGAGTGSIHGPSIIRFNGNGEAWEYIDPGSVRDYVDQGINLLVFNYRGVNESTWAPVFGSQVLGELIGRYTTIERDGIVLDCMSVIQYVVKGLGVKEDKVLLLGHSIGGAFSLQASVKHHPRACICSSRSFSKLSCTVREHAAEFLGVSPTSWIGKFLKWLGGTLVHVTGWELNSVEVWHKTNGFKWIEFCKKDHIIPVKTSLYEAAGGVESNRVLELESLRGDNHNRALTIMELREHLALVETALSLPGTSKQG